MISQEIQNYVKNQIASDKKDSLYSTKNSSGSTHNGIDGPKIPYVNLSNAPGYFCSSTLTNGTSPVFVFGGNKGFNAVLFNATITGVFVGSNDSTAGTVTVTNNGQTVTTVAKSVTPGTVTNATSVTNTTYVRGNKLSVVSSSGGNSFVFITFTS